MSLTKGNSSEKFNDSCIRVFDMLKLLSEGTVKFSDMFELFRDSNGKLEQKSNVTLNKYMNTLRIFGIEVKKEKNIYYLMKMPFSVNLSEEGIYSVGLIKSAMNYMPNSKYKSQIGKLVGDLERRYDYSTQKLGEIVSKYRNYDLSFYFKKFEKQIEECETYCQKDKRLEIKYVSEDGSVEDVFCSPIELRYSQKRIYFRVNVPLLGENVDIPMENIKSIRPLYTQFSKSKVSSTVVFKLRGPLAKRYKLREWETSSGIDSDGWMTVTNAGEDRSLLMKRLLKYDSDCVLVSPKYLRDKMLKIIDKTLKNYR